MNRNCHAREMDYGGNPYVVNMGRSAVQNTNFRTAVWTGCQLQMTMMSIPPCGEIGLEMHMDTEQMIRVEQGNAVVRMGFCKEQMEFQQKLCCGDAVFIPAGTWHNVINIGRIPLKISSVYAPPDHRKGTVHLSRKDAEEEAPL